MSCLLNIQALAKRYSFKPLFENLSFSIHAGDKLGLLGRNGVGKSTLLKILMQEETPDAGSVTKSKGIKIALVQQFPVFEDKAPFDILIENTTYPKEEALVMASCLLTQAGLDGPMSTAAHLSGGQKKKLDILKALMKNPDILFLDEPTNHLDLDTVFWLETFIQKFQKTVVIVSHDRTFLARTCKKFMELSPMFPEGNFTHTGTLDDFFEKKQVWIEGETKRMQALSHQVDHEIAWMKRSPKARTTKSVYRSGKALGLEQELKTLKSQLTQSTSELKLTASQRETRLLIQGKNLSKSYQDKVLFKGLDLILNPGKTIGLLGPNGCGKTTLLKILAGQIQPDAGTLKFADKLDIVYFDQHKMELNPKDLVKDVLSPNGEFVTYNDQAIHVNGWAKRFLFTQDTLRLPVEKLSGGEKSRLLIAKLMLKKADVLLLDEPTNDLDIQTLEILEDSLKDFRGACVIISHDRYFLNQVCDEFLALSSQPEGVVYHDFTHWEQDRQTKVRASPKGSKDQPSVTKQRLSSLEQKELKKIEVTISLLEKKASDLELEFSKVGPEDRTNLAELYQQLGSYHSQIEQLFARWEELEAKQRDS